MVRQIRSEHPVTEYRQSVGIVGKTGLWVMQATVNEIGLSKHVNEIVHCKINKDCTSLYMHLLSLLITSVLYFRALLYSGCC